LILDPSPSRFAGVAGIRIMKLYKDNHKYIIMNNIKITDEYLDETLEIANGVYMRNQQLDEIPNKFELLCKTVKYLTGKHIKSESLRFNGDIIKDDDESIITLKTCICSCKRCKSLFIIEDDETKKKFAVGSLCISKFDNEILNSDIYYHIHGKKCIICKDILIKRKNNSNKTINCDMKSDICWKCYLTPIYLNVPYEDKDYVKQKGAKWDVDERKWYIYRNNKNYYFLTTLYL